MKDAAALAAEGAPHGAIVVADEQTGGVGRHGHSWHSEPAAGLYMSMVLRMEQASPIITMALGLAVRRAVDDLAGVATDLRWPNDVMLNERKLAGILVQSVEGAQIAGIGVNANQTKFPPDIASIATSLRIETGRDHDKEALLQRIASEALRHIQLRRTEILRTFEAHSTYAKGKLVEVEGYGTGITAGLNENGFLLLSSERGLETVLSGGVRPL